MRWINAGSQMITRKIQLGLCLNQAQQAEQLEDKISQTANIDAAAVTGIHVTNDFSIAVLILYTICRFSSKF